MADNCPKPKIRVEKNGPYEVSGNLPLTRKKQVVTEYGEPITWITEPDMEVEEPYYLCRCGHSTTPPFCSNDHKKIGFDGTESAPTNLSKDRQGTYHGGTNIVVKKDSTLCMSSGFCGTKDRGIAEMISETDNTDTRSQVMAMVERCPAGSLVYSIKEGDPLIEPDLRKAIASSSEETSDGTIEGPLWLTGGVPVERSDGKPFETRNRVTLCGCGQSSIKPLCDGSHRITGRMELRKKKAKSGE